ncbi:MAG: anhydro-N-acetylmuramic acid kinase [Betaproteobacteria bacterium]|nr:anhydro-N-acetylmuramic acid kinase [Betaproteobacteria bacterium]
MSSPDSRLFIGLMSGTSVDAVDAVLVRLHTSSQRLETLSSVSVPFSNDLRQSIQRLQAPSAGELELAARVALSLAHLYAEGAQRVIDRAGFTARDITAIGAHGQTVRHRPAEGFTLQLLNAAQLAETTCIPVVYDLRPADIAAGGQGAPLVPAFHAHVFADQSECRAVVNIGGIANISVLPAAAPNNAAQVLGHDTGPGNTLLDQWHERHQGERFDAQGAWAAGGTADPNLLAAMLADDYFHRPPPKSTGRDDFNLEWLDRHLLAHASAHDSQPLSARDVQATLSELTATTIALACDQAAPAQVFLCGGGVYNADLIRRITQRLPRCRVASTEMAGIDPMAVEAAAFAWLAARRVDTLPGNLPAVTGASGRRVLGSVADPWGRLRA